MDYIFSKGTCKKGDLYKIMLDKLKENGWKDISSKAATDFVVLSSKGNTGNKNLLLNLRDTNNAAANSIVSTDFCAMSYRLQDTYIPGAGGKAAGISIVNSTQKGSTGTVKAKDGSVFTGTVDALYHLKISTAPTAVGGLAGVGYKTAVGAGNYSSETLITQAGTTAEILLGNGITVLLSVGADQSFSIDEVYDVNGTALVEVAGTFGRPAIAWNNLFIAPVANANIALGKDTVLTYYIYADASKLILVLEFPSATTFLPVVIYMGETDTKYVQDSDARGLIVATSIQAPAVSGLYVNNASDGMPSVQQPYVLTAYTVLPPIDPNVAEKYMIAPIYYGSAVESFRGILDGIKNCAYTGSNLVSGDTMVTENEKYHCVITHTSGNSSFPSRGILVRIE
jgi:hypothetical protein